MNDILRKQILNMIKEFFNENIEQLRINEMDEVDSTEGLSTIGVKGQKNVRVPFSLIEKGAIEAAEDAREAIKNIAEAIRKAIADLDIHGNYLSKVNPDTAQGLIRFLDGIEIGRYIPSILHGSGAALKQAADGKTFLEVDNLYVRNTLAFLEAFMQRAEHVGGQLIVSPAKMVCVHVSEYPTFYRCFFEPGVKAEASNQFVAGDQAKCQVFSGGLRKHYWRLVINTGPDYIDLSKDIQAHDSDKPEANDYIFQLGNRTNPKRQNAMIISTIGDDAPSFKQYIGIKTFALEGYEKSIYSTLGNTFDGIVTLAPGSSGLSNTEEWGDLVAKIDEARRIVDTNVAEIDRLETIIPPPTWDIFAVNEVPGAPNAIFTQSGNIEWSKLTLVPKFMRNGIDVTAIMRNSKKRLYEFERVNRGGFDDKGFEDTAWNLANRGATKVTLTHSDIVYMANINMIYDTDILEEEYQKYKETNI